MERYRVGQMVESIVLAWMIMVAMVVHTRQYHHYRKPIRQTQRLHHCWADLLYHHQNKDHRRGEEVLTKEQGLVQNSLDDSRFDCCRHVEFSQGTGVPSLGN